MKKNYTLILTLICLLSAGTLKAQFTLNSLVPALANGTSGNGRGPVTQFLFARSCGIYKASEFAGLVSNGDSIQRIGWSINTAGASVTGTMKIFLANTTDSTFARSSTWATLLTTPTALTQVYNGPMTIPAAITTYSVFLTTGFKYTGGGLYVAYEWTPNTTGTAAVYNCNTTITGGQWNAQSATSLPVTLATSNFRPQILVGVKPKGMDARVNEIYTLGKMPIPYTVPHIVKANVSNVGTDTLINYPLILNITGANPFIDTFRIDTFFPNTVRQISFAAFTPTINGNNVVNVLFPPDSNNSNNSKSFNQIITSTTYTYAEPTLPPSGGVGFNGGTGDFVAKFPYSGVANAINQVGVNFFAGGVSLSIGIWSRNVLTGLPGTLLWQSSTFTSSAGLNTIPVSPAVAIADTFFVGVIQSSTTNASFAYQGENPIRSQTFFFRSPTATGTWTDFAPNNSFRFMIEPRLQSADDVGFTSVDYPCIILPQGQTPFNPIGTLTNYGTLTQSFFNVKCAIFNAANTRVYIDSTTAPTILAGQSAPVSFPSVFNPNTAGTFTVKIWSELSGDASSANDTVTGSFVVNNNPLVGGVETRLEFNGTTGYIEIPNKSSIKPINGFTVETWVLGNNALLNNGCIYSTDSSNSDTSITIETIGRRIGVTLRTSNGLFFLTSNDTIPTNNWAHVAVSYNGAELTVYVNGDTAGTIVATGTVLYKASPVYIGRRSGSKSTAGVSVLNGGLDEFRIWNIERTQTQIIENMHRKLANFSEPNLVAYYRMNEAFPSALVADASGNCNSGTLVNLNPNTQWLNGSVLLDTTKATIFNITTNNLQTSTTHQIGVKAENIVGTGSFAVYSALQPIIGTLPTGFTNNSTRTWMLYKYGDLTFDSLRVEFGVPSGSILSTSTNSDLALNGRLMGFGAWTNTRNSAASFQTVSNNYKVNFLLLNTDSFNKQFVVSSNTNSLPVKLIAFNGSKEKEHIVLKWTTVFELNNKGFEVERSIDGKNFRYIDFVKGNGSSSQLNNYQFIDESTKNATVYYRLKQIDMDGKFDYSSIVSINGDDFGSIELVEVSPNPFDAELQVKVATSSDKAIKLALYNANGKLVMDRNVGASFGSNIIAIEEANTLAKGLYILKVSQNGVTKTLKIVK